MKKLILIALLIVGSLQAGFFEFTKERGVAPVSDKFYEKECASCHFAYQPGLLPSKS
jgi:hypothetical protein